MITTQKKTATELGSRAVSKYFRRHFTPPPASLLFGIAHVAALLLMWWLAIYVSGVSK